MVKLLNATSDQETRKCFDTVFLVPAKASQINTKPN